MEKSTTKCTTNPDKMHSSTHLSPRVLQKRMDHVLIHLDSTYPAAVVAGVKAAAVVGAVVVDLGVAAAVVPLGDNVLKLNAPTLPDAIPKPRQQK